MLKLQVGRTKKVGRPHYGSLGAAVQLELELESGFVDDAERLQARIQALFALAESAVDEELRSAVAAEAAVVDGAAVNCAPRVHDRGRAGNRRATQRQVRALEVLAERCAADLPHLATFYFRVDDVTQLTRRQAGLLIERLQERCDEPATSETQVV